MLFYVHEDVYYPATEIVELKILKKFTITKGMLIGEQVLLAIAPEFKPLLEFMGTDVEAFYGALTRPAVFKDIQVLTPLIEGEIYAFYMNGQIVKEEPIKGYPFAPRPLDTDPDDYEEAITAWLVNNDYQWLEERSWKSRNEPLTLKRIVGETLIEVEVLAFQA